MKPQITKLALKNALFHSLIISSTEKLERGTRGDVINQLGQQFDENKRNLEALIDGGNKEEIKAHLTAMLIHAMNN